MIALTDVVDAVGAHLTTRGVGQWPPNATTGRPPIVAKRLPATPREVVVVTATGADPTVPGGAVIARVQVRVRAPTVGAPADPLADRIRDTLTDHPGVWGRLHVGECRHLYTAQLGADTNELDERTDHYQLTINP